MDSDDDVVSVRPCSHEPPSDRKREVRISCPDATGLGCDVARMLMDFALRVLEGDMSTDGQWCFLVFKVMLAPGVPSRWPLLQSRLLQVCPNHATSVPLWRWHSSAKDDQPPFLLRVAAYDRRGVLHDLVQTLWEVGLQMFRARIATTRGGHVSDEFWICDETRRLPDAVRKAEIVDAVCKCLHSTNTSTISIDPVPPGELPKPPGEPTHPHESPEGSHHSLPEDPSNPPRGPTTSPSPAQGKLCKDSRAAMPLRRLLSIQRTCSEPGRRGFLMTSPAEDPLGHPHDLEVTIDNTTSKTHSVVSVTCADRKGLVYDLMRILKDVHVRTAYGKISTEQAPHRCSIDLFVQEADNQPITDEEMQAALVERVRQAVVLPVRIRLSNDSSFGNTTQLLVTAPVDSGGRGRPRVTYDVTAALNSLRLHVVSADVYTEEIPLSKLPEVLTHPDIDPSAEEVHSFLINKEEGGRLATQAEQQAVYDAVVAQLTGVAAPAPSPTHTADSGSNNTTNGSKPSAKRGNPTQKKALDLDQARSAQLLESLDTWTLAG